MNVLFVCLFFALPTTNTLRNAGNENEIKLLKPRSIDSYLFLRGTLAFLVRGSK